MLKFIDQDTVELNFGIWSNNYNILFGAKSHSSYTITYSIVKYYILLLHLGNNKYQLCTFVIDAYCIMYILKYLARNLSNIQNPKWVIERFLYFYNIECKWQKIEW